MEAAPRLSADQRRLLAAQLLQAAQLLPVGPEALPAVVAALRRVAVAVSCCPRVVSAGRP